MAAEDLRLEYQELGNNMRIYIGQRYTQLTPYAVLVTALGALEYSTGFKVVGIGKVGAALTGVLISAIFLVLDRRGHWYWNRYVERARRIEEQHWGGDREVEAKWLQYTGIPEGRKWLNATTAAMIFYVVFLGLWIYVLGQTLAPLRGWDVGGPEGAVALSVTDVAVCVCVVAACITVPGLRGGR